MYLLKHLRHLVARDILFGKLLKAISTYEQHSNCVEPIRTHLPPIIFALQRQIKGMGEGNRFCCLIPQITFELPGNRQFVLYKFWKVEFLLKL